MDPCPGPGHVLGNDNSFRLVKMDKTGGRKWFARANFRSKCIFCSFSLVIFAVLSFGNWFDGGMGGGPASSLFSSQAQIFHPLSWTREGGSLSIKPVCLGRYEDFLNRWAQSFWKQTELILQSLNAWRTPGEVKPVLPTFASAMRHATVFTDSYCAVWICGRAHCEVEAVQCRKSTPCGGVRTRRSTSAQRATYGIRGDHPKGNKVTPPPPTRTRGGWLPVPGKAASTSALLWR